jgi:colanic acid/amylovoran biosynthesis glycosyltransferase
MNVLHSVPIWLAQTENWIYQQIQNLPDTYESHVLCKRVANLDRFPCENLVSLGDYSRLRQIWERGLVWSGLRSHWSVLSDLVRDRRIGLLHSHFGDVGWANAAIARKLGLPHVVTFYGQDVGYLPQKDARWYKRYRNLFLDVDRVLCEGPFMADCVAQLGCPREKLQVHHLGVDLESLPYRPRQWRPGETLRVLMAATFREKKGLTYALEALAQLRDRLPIEVTLIGDAGTEARAQEEKRKILEVIERHDMQSYVRMMGYQSHAVLQEEAYNHHLFVSPSVLATNGDSEGGVPVAIIEMCATGMPVVSTTHCDIPEVIKNGQTGFMAEERDVADLAKKLLQLIYNVDHWPTMLAAGRKHIEQEYDAKVQGRRLGEIYLELVLR